MTTNKYTIAMELQDLLIDRANGRNSPKMEEDYRELRTALMRDVLIRPSLPFCVYDSRTLDQFAVYIAEEGIEDSNGRKKFLWNEFKSLLRSLEDKELAVTANSDNQSIQNAKREDFPSAKELEQKFRILLSPAQEELDYLDYRNALAGTESKIALLFLDIDHFKRLNTKYTETVIDETILPEFQKLIASITAMRGSAYRHGGEEFLVILPNHEPAEALSLADRMRRKIATHDFVVGEDKANLTISIGVSVFPDHGDKFATVLKNANAAEHSAKSNGRNKAVLFNTQTET